MYFMFDIFSDIYLWKARFNREKFISSRCRCGFVYIEPRKDTHNYTERFGETAKMPVRYPTMYVFRMARNGGHPVKNPPKPTYQKKVPPPEISGRG